MKTRRPTGGSTWRAGLLVAACTLSCAGSRAADPAPAVGDRGPALGAPLPAFELPDQDGKPRTLESLRGPNGLLLSFNRSVVW